MSKYRKRPVVIEAYQYRAGEQDGSVAADAAAGSVSYHEDGTMLIRTLEGEMCAQPGDWIIRGVLGELYPCKPAIFEATYEPVEEEFSFSLYRDPALTHGTVKRSPFVKLVAREIGYEDTAHYVAADAVLWVEQGENGSVMVRLTGGHELITEADPVTLCVHLEAALTQRMTYGGRHA